MRMSECHIPGAPWLSERATRSSPHRCGSQAKYPQPAQRRKLHLGRLRVGLAAQKHCNLLGAAGSISKAEGRMPKAEGRRQKCGPDRVGGRQKYNANPMESLWSTYGIPMEFLWSNTRTTRQQRAERAGAGRTGSGESAELRSLVVRLAGAEGFAGWPGRGRKEEAKAKVPARRFDRAPDGIPGSNFPDEPDIASRCPAFQWHPTVTPP
jgi:hypothetical protein